MSRTITISDDLYGKLEAQARLRGLNSVEQLLEQLQAPVAEPIGRKDVVRQIDELRNRLFDNYGQMPDSIDLLREDRAR